MTNKMEVTVKHDPEGHLRTGKPAFLLTLEKKWITWTGMKEEAVFEAINDISGDLFLSLRKLTALLCSECENRKLPEDFKELVKTRIDETWRDIIEKQKVGIDKLAILVRSYLDERKVQDVKKEETPTPSSEPRPVERVVESKKAVGGKRTPETGKRPEGTAKS